MDDFSIDFACDEDFGLAKSFTTTPMFQVAPLKNFSNTGVDDVEKDVNAHNLSEVKAEGFCFRRRTTLGPDRHERESAPSNGRLYVAT